MRNITAVCLLCLASAFVDELAGLVLEHEVTVLGERHRRPESPHLVGKLADRITADGDCLAVALEIPSDQAAALDAAVTGTAPASAVRIHPIIDSPYLRKLIEDLRDLAGAGRCLTVAAVDAPAGGGVSRDRWIADRIEELAADRRVLALLGNLHAMQWTRWENGRDDPHAAELLERRGLDVLSIMQTWPGSCSQRTGRYVSIQNPAAAEAVVKVISTAAVRQPADLAKVVDGVVVWECTPAQASNPR